MRLIILTILTFLLAQPIEADELNDILNREVAQYIAANPAALQRVETPIDVVRVWRDMVMVGKMVQLAAVDALPPETKPQITRRVGAATISMFRVTGHEENPVALLASTTLMFAQTVEEYRSGRVPYGTFGHANALLTSKGTVALARSLEAKYAKPGQIIPLEKPMTKW